MEHTPEIKLDSSEIGSLWAAYMHDSMALCMIECFLNNVQDQETRQSLQTAYDYSRSHVEKISAVFTKEGLPIPKAFDRNDYNTRAHRLYTDSFYLFFIAKLSVIGLNTHSLALTHSTRSDIRLFFSDCLAEAAFLFNKLIDIMENKGIYIKAPVVEVTREVSFIEDPGFLDGILKKEPRSLLTLEITGIYANIFSNLVGTDLVTGFAQVAQSQQVKQYMLRGKEIASSHVKTFRKILEDGDIPVPSSSLSFVTDSTEFTFSDKLMMFAVSGLICSSIPSYITAMSSSLRHDLQTEYMRLSAEIAKYASDGTKIMIHNRWLEQPPQAISHVELAKV